MSIDLAPFDKEEIKQLREAAVHALIEAIFGFGLITGKEKKALDRAFCHDHRGEKKDISH